MFDSIREFFKSTIIYGLIGGSRSFIEFLLLPIYARFLTPADFGRLDILMIFVMIGLVLAILEINNALFRFYFDYNTIRDRSKIVMTALMSSSINGFIIFIGALLFSKSLASLALNSSDYSYLFILAAGYVFLDAIVTVPINLLRVENKPVSYTSISLIQVFISIIGIIFFVIMLKWGVAGILVAKNISIMPTIVFTFIKTRKYLSKRFDFALLRKMLKFSLPLIPLGVALWGVNSLNRLFMIKYLTLEQIGYFSIGMKFVVPLTLSVVAFQLAWPQFALANMHSEKAGNLYSEIFNIFIAFELCLVLFLSLFAEAIIPYVMTAQYLPVIKVILPLSFGMFLYGVFFFLTTGEFIKKATTKIIPPIFIALIANIVLNIILTPKYGIMGTAWVMMVTYLFMIVVMFSLSRKFCGRLLRLNKLGRLAIVSSAMFFISISMSGMNSPFELGLKLAVFLAFPVLLFVSGFLSKTYLYNMRSLFLRNSGDLINNKEEYAESPIE
ncbi:MAG: oligosaccharide flippase family protein [candidate division Zixibacteria bacterium]|nr:oligosaccharide flippase family protein [candidate division Zixibacteria bacterium]